jgi:SAM-dependent methyltransferase
VRAVVGLFGEVGSVIVDAVSDEAATRGLPSYVWRAGQSRRLDLIRHFAPYAGRRVIDVGCGVGMYVRQMAAEARESVGVEIDWARAREARAAGVAVVSAAAEDLPFADGTFDVLLSHEVLEHVRDDRAAMREAVRVLAPGGRAVVFVPNRWWPFETHGVYRRGRYHFGNVPLVNYLPDVWRNRLAPHVRVYTGQSLRALLNGLPVEIVDHRCVFPGYDKLMARRPGVAALARRITYRLERTRIDRFGLSRLLVVQRPPEARD